MACLKRIVLDVLKPHEPTVLEFADGLAAVGPDYRISMSVTAVDKNTENVEIEVCGSNIDFAGLHEVIRNLGGSLHSIDEVDVESVAGEGEGGR